MRERTEGKTAYAIARDLNKDAVPTAQGAPAFQHGQLTERLTRSLLPAQPRTADRAYESGVDNHVKPPYRSTGHLSTVGRAQLAQLTAKGLPRSFLTGMAV